MNIVFMGTPDFSLPSLKILLKSKHQILAVVTQPDKVRGRGQKVSFTPVKQFAIENNIPVYQPEKLKGNEEFVEQMKALQPDLFVVVAFRILPKEVFEIPKFGSFNLHGSYLPKYRGAAPIQWALINGETETGLTTFKLAEKVDTGTIYLHAQRGVESFLDRLFLGFRKGTVFDHSEVVMAVLVALRHSGVDWFNEIASVFSASSVAEIARIRRLVGRLVR